MNLVHIRKSTKSKHRSSKKHRDTECNPGEQKIRLFEGWNYSWKTPNKRKKNPIEVHTVVPGPFSKPNLIKASPYVVLQNCSTNRSRFIQECCPSIKRGIPNTWIEYLAWKEFGDNYEKEVAKRDVSLGHEYLRVTDHLWNGMGLSMAQGIPDPWKNLPVRAQSSSEESSDGEIEIPIFPPVIPGGCRCVQRNVVRCPDDVACPFAAEKSSKSSFGKCEDKKSKYNFASTNTHRKNYVETATDASELDTKPKYETCVKQPATKKLMLTPRKSNKNIATEENIPDEISALKFVCCKCNCPYLKVSCEKQPDASDDEETVDKGKGKTKGILENLGDIVLRKSPGVKNQGTSNIDKQKSKDNLFKNYEQLVVRKAPEVKSGSLRSKTVNDIKRKPKDVSDKCDDVIFRKSEMPVKNRIVDKGHNLKDKTKLVDKRSKPSVPLTIHERIAECRKLLDRDKEHKSSQLNQPKKPEEVKSTIKTPSAKSNIKPTNQYTKTTNNEHVKRSKKPNLATTASAPCYTTAGTSDNEHRITEEEREYSCGCSENSMKQYNSDYSPKKNKNYQDDSNCYPCCGVPNFDGSKSLGKQGDIENLKNQSDSLSRHRSGPSRVTNVSPPKEDHTRFSKHKYKNVQDEQIETNFVEYEEDDNISTNDMVMPFETSISPKTEQKREHGGADGGIEKVSEKLEDLFERRYKITDGNSSECSERIESSLDEQIANLTKYDDGADPSCYLKHCYKSTSLFQNFDEKIEEDMIMKSFSEEET